MSALKLPGCIRRKSNYRHTKRRIVQVGTLLTLCVLASARPVYADDLSFLGGGTASTAFGNPGYSWTSASNWLDLTTSTQRLPTLTDNVTLSTAIAQLLAGTANAGSLTINSELDVATLLSASTLNVAKDLDNEGTMQVGGIGTSSAGIAFSYRSGNTNYAGTNYTAVLSAANLLGSGNSLTNGVSGTLTALNGGFVGSHFTFNTNNVLTGASGTYSTVENDGTLTSTGGMTYTATTQTRTNLSGTVVGHDTITPFISSNFQLYGGGAGSQFNNTGTLGADGGGLINVAGYDAFNNNGGQITSDGSTTFTYKHGDNSGHAYTTTQTASTQIALSGYSTLNPTGTIAANFGTFTNSNNGLLSASNGGQILLQHWGSFVNDATSTVQTSDTAAFEAVVDNSLTNAGTLSFTGSGGLFAGGSISAILQAGTIDNSGSLSQANGQVVVRAQNTFTNEATGTLQSSGGSYSLFVNGNAGLSSSLNVLGLTTTTNNGSLLATNGGQILFGSYQNSTLTATLNLGSTSYVNADGTGIAFDLNNPGNLVSAPSLVLLTASSQINNAGEVSATNGGAIIASTQGTLNNQGGGYLHADGGYYDVNSQWNASSLALTAPTLNNFGNITANGGGSVTLGSSVLSQQALVFNNYNTVISTGASSGGNSSVVAITDTSLTNNGHLEALDGGRLNVSGGDIYNNGTAVALGSGSSLQLSGTSLTSTILVAADSANVSINVRGDVNNNLILGAGPGFGNGSTGSAFLNLSAGGTFTNQGNFYAIANSFLFANVGSVTNNNQINANTGGQMFLFANNQILNGAVGSISASSQGGTPGQIGLTANNLVNQGQIGASEGGAITASLQGPLGTLLNAAGGQITADGLDSTGTTSSSVALTASGSVTNQGTIGATNGGTVTGTFQAVVNSLLNAAGGLISADGSSTLGASTVTLTATADVTNQGSIAVTNGGQIVISGTSLSNGAGGLISADGVDSTGTFSSSVALTTSGSVSNQGSISVTNGGQIVLSGTSFSSGVGGLISADGSSTLGASSVTLTSTGTVVNQGTIAASNGGQIGISHSGMVNSGSGAVHVGASSGISLTNTAGSVALQQTSSPASIHVDGQLTLVNGVTSGKGELDLGQSGDSAGAGGTLSGTGTISGNVVNFSGVVMPGDATGVLTINGDYTQGANGVLDIALDGLGGVAGVEGSFLDINGDLILPDSLTTINFDLSGFDFSTVGLVPEELDFLSAYNLDASTLTDLTYTFSNGSFSGYDYSVLIDSSTGNLAIRAFERPTVPEPGSLALLAGISAAGVSLLYRRRQSRA